MKQYHWIFAVTGVVLGILLAIQFKVTKEIRYDESLQELQNISAEITLMTVFHKALQDQVSYLRAELDNITILSPDLKEELEVAKVQAGVTELSGSGIEVTLNDSNVNLRAGQNANYFLLHDDDLLLLLNEMKAAGAEAISINGQRLLATTEVRCTGPTIILNKNKRLVPPFVVTAIGNADTLESSLKMKGGVLELLQGFGIQVSVKKMDQVTVPAHSGGVNFDYAESIG